MKNPFKGLLYRYAHQTQRSLVLFLLGLGLFYSGLAAFYYVPNLSGVIHTLGYYGAIVLLGVGFTITIFAYLALTYYRWFNLIQKPKKPASKDENKDNDKP